MNELFNKKGLVHNQQMSYKLQNMSFCTTVWSYLCKICKPLYITLANNEYAKFKWFGNTVVFWRIDNKVHKTIYLLYNYFLENIYGNILLNFFILEK